MGQIRYVYLIEFKGHHPAMERTAYWALMNQHNKGYTWDTYIERETDRIMVRDSWRSL